MLIDQKWVTSSPHLNVSRRRFNSHHVSEGIMSVVIGELEFEGPFLSIENLNDAPGIFAVVNAADKSFDLVEMNDSDLVKETLKSHPHLPKWQKICPEVSIMVHYTKDLSTKERKFKRETAERKRIFSYAS